MKRLYFVVAATLLAVAIFAVAPFGQATSVVNKVVPMSKNSDKVDGIHAARTAHAGRLVTLGADGKFTSAVIPQDGTSMVSGPITVLDPLGGVNSVNSSAATCPAGSAPVGGGWDFGRGSTPGPIFATVAANRAFGSQWGVIMVSNTSNTPQQFRAFALCSQGAQVPSLLTQPTSRSLAAELAQLRAAVKATKG